MLDSLCNANVNQLKKNSYPGRGIIVGLSPNSKKYYQVYWIMGRSSNSRNRIFVNEGGFVRTEAHDKNQLEDPTLIIYYPIKFYNDIHIVSNGDQTDTIYDSLINDESFECALNKREFEPDFPNLTPRISGMIDLNNEKMAYQLSILKSVQNDPNYCIRNYYNYERAVPGVGHCLHTYSENGNPLPSFVGEPFEVKLYDDIKDVGEFYWSALNEENKISLLVKSIDIEMKSTELFIINRNR
ncbi:IMP cyclohydrolase [Bacillus solimangrovi]|uniref:Inosine monophosphate cyclohydrolase n=1 Tax=Bacillus solimangrovi TaxID=1305675 RepID=A0A1E5LAJ2_9BACI|nr:IMP cyclohydrolase [Bacillus solimangrovi]OEH91102.1 inosine monophosphate cyclohydrolase [Bacillus solimangrovi]